MDQVISLAGSVALMACAVLFSTRRQSISWRTVVAGFLLQMCFAAILFVFPPGRKLFSLLNTVVVQILDYSREGAILVFGALGVPPGQTSSSGEKSLGFFLAFQGFPTIIFFSALMSALYFLRIMQWILRLFSMLFSRSMRLSGAEALCAASNIFVGIESVFSIRPYLRRATRSELLLILTAGMATIASSVLGFYTLLLRDVFPSIAGHLITASLLSAPAAVVMAKILLPEQERPETFGRVVTGEKPPDTTLVEAILRGANEGMKLAMGVAALLIAFLGLAALVNGLLGWLSGFAASVGIPIPPLSLEKVLGWIFYPFTLLIGVPVEDAGPISKILGERTIITELICYKHLSVLIQSNTLVHPRSAILASYALCGFSHIAAVAIFVGGVASLVPERAADVARLGMRALLASTLACFQTAAISGLFIGQGAGYLFGG